jgi:5-methylcytosine-specific restriction enzyme A
MSYASRRAFIEKTGATCANWNWSWSFVNHEKKFVIFTAWKDRVYDGTCRILSPEWKFTKEGRRRNGYDESVDNVHLVADKGYILYLLMTTVKQPYIDGETRQIASIDKIMKRAELARVDDDWFGTIIKTETSK